jgi:hypothetical protein
MTLNVLGTASTEYLQNLVFHKNAFALAVVPMEKPAGAMDVACKSHKGLSVRVVPYYDGVNDISNYRLDVMFGVKTLDGRLATRLSGSPRSSPRGLPCAGLLLRRVPHRGP